MMGVYIKGMDIPTACSMCTFHHEDYMGDERCDIGWKKLPKAGEKPKSCPLVPVPPHGRLIDADAFLQDLLFPSKEFERGMRELVGDAPTVIPASEEGE